MGCQELSDLDMDMELVDLDLDWPEEAQTAHRCAYKLLSRVQRRSHKLRLCRLRHQSES